MNIRLNAVYFFCCLGAAVTILSCSSPDDVRGKIGSVSSEIICGGVDNRAPVTTLTYPRGAVGRLNNGCSGTIISPTKVMTAAHCLGDPAPSSITFQPQFGILVSGMGPAASTASRITLGRDASDTPIYADWAILTFTNNFQTQLGANYQQMYRVLPTSTPFSVTLIGYHADFYSNRPGFQDCAIDFYGSDGKTLFHSCDVRGGASGGPHYFLSGGLAQMKGIQSGEPGDLVDNCTGEHRNSAASGEYYSFAPDNAVGTAIAYNSDGNMRVFASDMDWSLIAYRDKSPSAPSGWAAWNALDSGYTSTGRRMAAVNLQDNRQQVWVVKPNGDLQTKWQNTNGTWTAWITQSTAVTVKDVSASGGNGVTSHLFILGTDNVVYESHKIGDANSQWSSWISLGTLTAANALSAVFFSSVHQVFAVTNTAAWTAWDGGGGFNQLQSFGGSGFSSVGAGTVQDGRVSVFAFGGGSLQMRIRAADGSSWSSWSTANLPASNPPNVTSLISLSARPMTGGPERVIGVGSNGNIYTITETSAGVFSGPWTRFYL